MNAADVALALGGHRHGAQWRCKCPAHNDHDPSLDVRDTIGGVLVNCRAGCSQRDVIAALMARGLWERMAGAADEREHSERLAQAARERVIETQRKFARAMALWDEAVDAHLSPAEYYLRRRGLALPGECEHVLRFHARCPRGSERVPALVALMRNVETGHMQAIQRIYIRADFRKDKCEASPNGAKTLGQMRGAAMMITSWHDTFWDCLSYCPTLYVAEGLETALAMKLRGYAPMWALGSASNIANLPVLFGVGHLVICADNDVPKQRNGVMVAAGLDAARECAARWNSTPKQRATIWMPDEAGKDFADGAVH